MTITWNGVENLSFGVFDRCERSFDAIKLLLNVFLATTENHSLFSLLNFTILQHTDIIRDEYTMFAI